ncbi:hypothetical protein HNE_1939 [Hyphomonas neptunium ATCC 15444]|uniref:Lipoprotein n=2 Tax=Hyphomonas TaxID=85 RepID=Q0C0V3_HYPNA|nr:MULTISPECIES: hypothetical protein [Hyphomonas]ABI76875.1 hypothetical protein HNE_1939 [Hyphomonas neptunium ATCC 15444]KCZ94944.1 hypothetical protein HHI_06842 [Hyphomonas hirschiana VP5]
MRTPLIALIPAVLIAGAAYAQQETQPADPAPAEQPDAATEAEAGAEPDAEAEKAPPPPQVQTTEAAGSWTRSTEGGRETVTYTSNEGETLFSATCMIADTEFGDRIVQIKAASSDDTVGAIDIFTSAGNARVPAGPDVAPDTAAGMTETVSQPTYVLASGAGEMRIVSGSRGIIFDTDPMLKSLIRDCQPDHMANLEAAQAEAPDEEAEADSEDAAEEAETNS